MIIVTKKAAFNLDRHPLYTYRGDPDGEGCLCFDDALGGAIKLGIQGAEKIAAALSRIADYAGRGERVCKLFDFCD